ncbi:Organelle rrm domain-containing protein 1 protein [Thalictrum thalictroides]|uniref:Organelle rrm domain-containing protein 1 protein n=1 Tax=Thalictrum thalictroides TaxID=46969 RepID=A0A7J6VR59_THATH|nr:Organelle rrm domain-containing protein 1 protein [Thalictrum thalictroides]
MAGTMKLHSPTSTTSKNIKIITIQPLKAQLQTSIHFPNRIKLPNFKNTFACKIISSGSSTIRATTSTTSDSHTSSSFSSTDCSNHWIVIMKKPQEGIDSKTEVIDYYVKTLAKVLGSEKDAQMCIHNISWQTHFGFCCDIDEETRRELVRLPEILSIRPDPDVDSLEKNYSLSNLQFDSLFSSSNGTTQLFSELKSKYWLVRMDKPSFEVITKAQMVDHYAQVLTKVLGNERDAQMCMYHISWQNNFGFCCELDEECAQVLKGVPGVLSVQTDENFGSEYKNYGGEGSSGNPADTQAPAIKTKRLFVTGLSFYTSEKTLRAAFEGFGELVEVKIIMDKISKRSKGYAFIEYTTEEAASTALKEMNGKIINGWMIVVDVAKTNPPKYSRGSPRPIY